MNRQIRLYQKAAPTIAAITNNCFDLIYQEVRGTVNTYDRIIELALLFEQKYKGEKWGESPNELEWEETVISFVNNQLSK